MAGSTNQQGELVSLAGNEKIKFTDIGGLAVKLANGTGGATIKGTAVALGDPLVGDTAGSFKLAPASSFVACGIVLESGIAAGQDAWVVISGFADVLIKDGTAATKGYWAKMSDVAGRVGITEAEGPMGSTYATLGDHMREIGFAVETQGSGTDVLCRALLHFN